MARLDGSYKAEEQLAARAAAAAAKFIAHKTKPTKGQNALTKALDPLAVELGLQGNTALNVAKKATDFMHNHNPVDAIDHLGKLATNMKEHFGKLTDPKKVIFDEVTEELGKPLIDSLIGATMGVSLSAGAGVGPGEAHQADNAIKTIRRVAGFCLLFPFAAAGLISVLKVVTHNHAPESLSNSIGSLGEELGLNWLLGNLLETVFETAVGQPLNELINVQTHPARLEMPILNRLAKQHKFEDIQQFEDALNSLGYRAQDIALIRKLDTNALSMADIQLAYLHGNMSTNEIRKYLEHSGFSDDDIDHLITIYIDHAETQGDTAYRQAALASFKDGRMNEGTLRDILKRVNTPPKSIDNEIAAAKLEEELKDKSLSMAILKAMYQRKQIDASGVHSQLEKQGYSPGLVDKLLKLWESENTTHHKGMSASQIVRYTANKVLTPQEGIARLTAIGWTQDDASFIIAHPTTHHAAIANEATPGEVINAYKHKILDYPSAIGKLENLGVNPTQANLMMQIAEKQVQPRVKHPPGTQQLNLAQIKEAYTLGLRDIGWVENEYAALGYDENEALLLSTILIAQTTPGVPTGGGTGGGLTG